MKYKLVLTLVLVLLSFSSLNAEPSAFGAGDMNNPSPYGLTQEEELLLQNKKNLKKVTVKNNNQSNELESIRDRIDGLQSIIENLTRNSHKNKQTIRSINENNSKRLTSSDEYEKRLSTISQNNNIEIEKLKIVISELRVLVDIIAKDYVTKSEFNALVLDVNKFKDLVSSELKSKTKKSDFSAKDKAQIAKDAKRFYDKKHYTKSIKYYSYLIESNYKPARAHYMIGEMQYYRKNYSEAIAYFKKSAKLYSKASYMPSLILHTAFSMKYTGDEKNAKAFFNAVINKFSGSKYAKEAKKQLDLMK